MVTQVTISPSFQAKMDRLDELIGEGIEEKLVSLGNYAVEISPVWSGAFVESWSLRPIGSSSGRRRTSNNKPIKDNASAKADARTNIATDAVRFSEQIVDKGGAVLTNRSPHAKDVDNKYLTITRVKDRFR
jgi:hypothetical protein